MERSAPVGTLRPHVRSARRLVASSLRPVHDRLQQIERRACRSFAVLAYHRVATPTHDPWALAVSPEHFHQQLEVMQALGRVVRLGDEVGRIRTTRLGRHSMRFAVTFDDGYVDNLRTALPILEAHEAPATVFVATGFLNRSGFWWDRLATIVFGSGVSVSRIAAAAVACGLLGSDGELNDSRDDLHVHLWEQLVGRRPSEIEALLDELSVPSGADVERPESRPMTTEELVELAQHPLIAIGAHTVDHRRLEWLEPDVVLSEIVDGNRELDRLIGSSRRSFAYPYGEAGRTTARIARNAACDHAMTTRPGWVAILDGRHRLPRLHPPDLAGGDFERWLLSD